MGPQYPGADSRDPKSPQENFQIFTPGKSGQILSLREADPR